MGDKAEKKIVSLVLDKMDFSDFLRNSDSNPKISDD